MKYLFMGLIRLYQLTVSRLLGPVCRFYPSCSHYGYEAFRRHGTLRGGWLTARRLLRCHPWNPGGVDPVPERRPVRSGPGRSGSGRSRSGQSVPDPGRSGRAGRFQAPESPPAAPDAAPHARNQPRQGAAR